MGVLNRKQLQDASEKDLERLLKSLGHTDIKDPRENWLRLAHNVRGSYKEFLVHELDDRIIDHP